MANYRLLIKLSAAKELERMPKKDRQRMAARIQALAQNPWPPGCEKLSGQERYRVRQGDYRTVYSIDDQEHMVRIVKIGHRREIYR